ncbi:hypothetical protein [uncultured Shewanella sp.]|uniref:hypothetical protein n=1 Tax=uncultured Shewanella sp. TaxID=173975 RepID=UPI002615DA96|nr:hypothetical protein [uncultured Shewanella sp.]
MKKRIFSERVKLFFYFFMISVFFYFTVTTCIDNILFYKQLGHDEVIHLYGLMNNISSWILSGFLFVLLIAGVFKIFSGRTIPLPMGIFMLIFSILGGLTGIVLDSMIRDKVFKEGYQECQNEAYFSRNASYKVFVLSQADCKDK